jgi:HAT1-interacting factor 1
MTAENFPQAVQDYTSALKIKSSLLPSSSRALASVHYQLATALEFTPNRRGDALSHVEKAVEGFKSRLSELRGEAVAGDEVAKLSEKEKYKEVEDVLSLLGDLEVKIEELKQAPPAEDLVSESINHLLGQPSGAVGNGSGEAKADSGPVNDLTGMVKKKKKPVQAAVQVTAQEVAGKGKEVADKLVKKVEAAGEVAEGVEGGIGGVAEEIADGINGKRKAEDKAGGEEKKIKAE